MKKYISKDTIIILSFISLFILTRSVYYSSLFRFIYDQIASSTVVYDLWQNKEISLLGPPMSLMIENRQIFFGGISYYIQMIFLLIGRWDPFWSTYAFMLFSSLMVAPLYFGVKKLINKNAAIFMLTVYSLLPFYIEGTTHLWNPYFQLSLMPIFIYLIALFQEKKSYILFLIVSTYAGILFQLHYQFLIVLIGLFIYYFVIQKLNRWYILMGVIGLSVGVGNLIFFELRNNFYLFQTIILFLQNHQKIVSQPMSDYYYMSILFLSSIPILWYAKKFITFRINVIAFIILFGFAYHFVVVTASDRNYPKGWYYNDDQKVFQIIKDNFESGEIQDFNVFEFYSATAATQKYYLKLNNIQIDYDDYYKNKYLYVVYKKDEDFTTDPAYEINSFRPHAVIDTWSINDSYTLYLLKRE